MLRLRGACSVTRLQTQKHLEPLHCYSPGLLSETLSDTNPDLLKLRVPLSFFFCLPVPTSCLLGASHCLGDTRCVPSQTWSGAWPLCHKLCPGAEPGPGEPSLWLMTVTAPRGSWVADQLLVLQGSLPDTGLVGRHCGDSRGLLEPPLPSLWTEPRASQTCVFPVTRLGGALPRWLCAL